MDTTYRVKNEIRKNALRSILFFVAIGTASTTFAYFEFANEPELAAVFFAIFWGFWILLSVWLLVFHARYRLHLGDSAVCQIGIIRGYNLALCEILEVRWRQIPKPAGSVRLSGTFDTLVIDLGVLKHEDCRHVIQFLRQMIDTSKHAGWEEFSRRRSEIQESEQKSG